MGDLGIAHPAPSRIAIIGVGKIGSTFAYQLARAGHDVTVIAHQAQALLPNLTRSRAATVHFMFVTFRPDRLAQALGTRATFGMPAVTASLDAEGHLKRTIGRQRTQHGDQRMADLFTAAGMPSAYEADMPLWLRCHVSMTAAMEAVSVLGVERGRGANWRQAAVAARGTRAGLEIITAGGEQPYPRSKVLMSRGPLFPLTFMLWSVSHIPAFRDLLGQGAGEARALIDAMLDEAASRPELAAQIKALHAMRPRSSMSPSSHQPSPVTASESRGSR